ncbi:F/Y-rich N-terminus-domain-containing protein, partial [Zopfochytrium polystomum]
GRPQLPIVVGVITILELGTIVWDRPAYHSERYIYPVGFKSSRQYLSIVDPNATVTYTCTIVEAGDAPKFVVTPEDAPDRAAVGNSATGAWATIVKTAHQLRNREHAGGASGPDFFGLSQGVVIKLIQDVPGARQCKNYIWQEGTALAWFCFFFRLPLTLTPPICPSSSTFPVVGRNACSDPGRRRLLPANGPENRTPPLGHQRYRRRRRSPRQPLEPQPSHHRSHPHLRALRCITPHNPRQ